MDDDLQNADKRVSDPSKHKANARLLAADNVMNDMRNNDKQGDRGGT
jgi:hypothetical protein